MPNINKNSFKAFLNFLDNNFAFLVIIIAVFIFGFSFGSMWKNKQLTQRDATKTKELVTDSTMLRSQQTPEKVSPVSKTDHFYGASDPKVTIIEYSDFGCPYSGSVHPTLKRLVKTYPNEVAWVYRHYLLGGTSSLTGVGAQVSECLATNNGNDIFWQFVNKVYEKAEANDSVVDEAGFYAIASSLGVAETGLKSCVESGLSTDIIEAHALGAKDVGIGGTPALVIVSSNGEFEFMAGAVPFESLENAVKKYF